MAAITPVHTGTSAGAMPRRGRYNGKKALSCPKKTVSTNPAAVKSANNQTQVTGERDVLVVIMPSWARPARVTACRPPITDAPDASGSAVIKFARALQETRRPHPFAAPTLGESIHEAALAARGRVLHM